MKKRGLSDLVAVVLMILIVVVAIGIIAFAINRSLNTLGSSTNNATSYFSNASNFVNNQAAGNQQNLPIYAGNPYNGSLPQAPTAANVLCVYNSDSNLSKQICDYYLQKRPGASELGLSIPDSEFINDTYSGGVKTWFFTREDMNISNFRKDIYDPIMSWVDSHPDKYITNLALAKDLPIRVYIPADQNYTHASTISSEYVLIYPSNYNDASSFINFLNQIISDTSYSYKGGIHFDPENYRNLSGDYITRFVVSFLDAYTLDDVKEMIDKAQSPTDLSSNIWLIDGHISSGTNTQAILIQNGINPANIVLNMSNSSPTILDQPVMVYGGSGVYHPNFIWNWVTQSIDFPVANRAIFTSYESYNSVSFWGNSSLKNPYRAGQPQALLADGFSPDAAGGSNYSRSFSGAAGSIDEPGIYGVVSMPDFFGSYASGLTLAESFMEGGLYRFNDMVVGDPIMRISDSNVIKEPDGYICGSDSDCSSNVCSKDQNGVMICHSDPNSCAFRNLPGAQMSNGSVICLDNTSTIGCLNGQWQSPAYCGSSEKCAILNSSFSFFVYAYQSACKTQNFQTCQSDSECNTGYMCIPDNFGVKKCAPKLSCLFNYSGTLFAIGNDTYLCDTDSSKRLCLNNEWQSPSINCSGQCINGFCLGQDDIFSPPDTFNFKASQKYAITLPVNETSTDSILSNAPVGTQLQIFSGNGWDSFSVIKLRSGSTVVSPSDRIIYPGAGLFVTIGANYSLNIAGTFTLVPAVNYSIYLNGTALTSSVPVNIAGMQSFIGIPYCGNNYTASSAIREINSIEPRCYMISTMDTGRGPVNWFSLGQQDNVSGIEGDFNLTNFNAYWIYCNSTDVNFTWTPSCNT